jgi:hypothetical protein
MNKLLRVALYALGIIVLYIWFSTVFKSCGTQETELAEALPTTEQVVNAEEYFEDEFEGGQTINLSEKDEFNAGLETPTTDFTEIETVEEATSTQYEEPKSTYQAPLPTTTNTNTRSTSSSYSSGKHMVIAGNFLAEANADKMVRKLKNMGYNSAEKVVFDFSEYFSVIAYRNDNYAAAADVSSDLKRSGVDNYLKARSN